MGLVSGLVDAADGMLESVAGDTFSALVSAGGTTIAAMATLALIMLGVNIVVQWRPLGPGQILVVAIKLVAITAIGLKWSEFYKIADAIETGMDRIAGAILARFGTADGGDVSSSLAGAIDSFVSNFANQANIALEPLSWMAGALMAVLLTLLLAIIGCMVGLALIFAKIMITVYLSLAPVFIALWIFDSTQDYFKRWVQGTVTYMIYPVVIAAVLGAIVGLVSKYISNLSTAPSGTISEFIPFIAALLIMIVVVAFIPFIVNSLTGTFAAPSPMAAVNSGIGMARTAKDAGAAVAARVNTPQVATPVVQSGQSLAAKVATRSGKF